MQQYPARFLRFSAAGRKTGAMSRGTAGVRPDRGFARSQESPKAQGGPAVHIDIIMLQPLVALLFGVLILILPRLLNYLIAIYLILVGLTGLFPHLFTTSAV
jgi:hypothetical protein